MKKLVLISLMALVLIVSAACGGNGNGNTANTQPETGIVEAVPGGPAELTQEQIDDFWAAMFDPETVRIIVNGEAIDAPTPFTDSEAGTAMLPVAAIAEALGYNVVVENDGSEIVIAPGTMLTEGQNSYFRGREAPIELESAPVVQDGVMFVPLRFFQEILSAAVYAQDGNIYVETVEN